MNGDRLFPVLNDLLVFQNSETEKAERKLSAYPKIPVEAIPAIGFPMFAHEAAEAFHRIEKDVAADSRTFVQSAAF